MKISKIVSGGQAGADRAALDAAIACGIPHGGWCPKGRRAEDGPIPLRYNLRETESADYADRTRANVVDSDVTLIFSHGPLRGGSLLTQQFAQEFGRPFVCIDLDEIFPSSEDRGGDDLSVFRILEENLSDLGNTVLNVAGPRASADPQIYDAVYREVCDILAHFGG